jgi:hypothetical protein
LGLWKIALSLPDKNGVCQRDIVKAKGARLRREINFKSGLRQDFKWM